MILAASYHAFCTPRFALTCTACYCVIVMQDARTAKLARLAELRAEVVSLDKELAQFAHSDPERLKELGV